MLSRISENIANILVENGNISSDNKEIYQYGFEMGIAQVINVITTLGIGFLLKLPLESLFFLICFMTLRTYTGGYHSASHLACYILSVTLTVVVLVTGNLITVFSLDYLGAALFAVGIVLLISLAPVEDKNKPMEDVEKVVFRKRAMQNLAIWSVITASLFFTPFRNISLTLCVSIFMIGVAVICGLIKNHIINRENLNI